MLQGELSQINNLYGEINSKSNLDGSLTVSDINYTHKPYKGDYVVTAGDVPVVVEVKDKYMKENIIVNPVPSNYGKITWNGFDLTIE